jgi:hypothetical protein
MSAATEREDERLVDLGGRADAAGMYRTIGPTSALPRRAGAGGEVRA